MKIAIIGGHLAPALAIIQALPQDDAVVFIGRKYGFEADRAITLEYKIIQDLGIPFFELPTSRLQRSFTKHTIPSLVRFPFGVIIARSILARTNPDVVVGFGGYLSVPVAIAAKTLGIPVVIHEQTLGLGLANRIIARFANAICISWDTTQEYVKGKNIILTGNPVREDFIHPKTPDFAHALSGDTPIVYITGGTSGSHTINELVTGCIEELLEKAVVVHQTGDAKEFSDYEKIVEKRTSLPEKLQKNYIVKKFIDPQEVGFIMKKATVVVGRAGVNTITELLYLKKPAVLIPLPYGQREEQMRNGRFLEKIGLAEVLVQDQATSKLLLEKITAILTHQNMYTIKHEEEKAYDGFSEAAENIVSVIKKVASPHSR